MDKLLLTAPVGVRHARCARLLPRSAGGGAPVTLGSDLDATVLCNELTVMLGWHEAGYDVFHGAPKDVVS